MIRTGVVMLVAYVVGEVAVEPLEQELEPLHAVRRVPRPRQLVALAREADELDVAP